MEWFNRGWRTLTTVEGIHGLVTSELVKPYTIPAGAAVVTALSGLITAVPLPYLITAMGVMFAAVATGLVRVDEWRWRTNVAGKLSFNGALYGVDTSEDGATLKGCNLEYSSRTLPTFLLRSRY